MPTKSLDTETTGKDFHHGCEPFFATVTYKGGEQAWWEWDVDPLTRKVWTPPNDMLEVLEAVEEGNDNPEDLLVLQNTVFDFNALDAAKITYGMSLTPVWPRVRDTLLAGHLLASNQPHDLTSMALIYLGVNIKPYEDKLKAAVEKARRIARSEYSDWLIAQQGLPMIPSMKSGKEGIWKNDMWLPRAIAQEKGYPNDHPWQRVLSEYSNIDSSVTLPLWEVMEQELNRRGLMDIYMCRLKVLPITYAMGQSGITLNEVRLDQLQQEYSKQADESHATCVSLSGGLLDKLPVAGTSNALKTVLFDKFELVSPRMTPKGNPSLDKSVLSGWLSELDEGTPAHTFIDNLLKYRKRRTALSYMEGYDRFMLPCLGLEGWYRMHPSLNPTGTDTLRWSSSNPNQQNISKQEGFNLRYCFGPLPGREWWSFDAKNIELRLPAYEAGETEMIQLFENPDEPPYFGSNHLLVFDTLHPDKWDRNDPEGLLKAKKKYASTWYQWTKNGNFAVQYGAMEASGTADRAYHVEGGQRIIQDRFSRIKELNQSMIDYATTHGYVETMPDKTVDPHRGYPLLCTRSKWGTILPTVPLNYHVQGTAMWWMMKAMIRCQEYLDKLNARSDKGYFMIMQVHDELVFDFPINTSQKVIKRIMHLMEIGGDDIGIPTPVSCERHLNNWSEGED